MTMTRGARLTAWMFAGLTMMCGVAAAQTPPAAAPRGYVEAFAQSAFGNVTSQAYGGEFGFTVWNGAQLFVEVGSVRNVASDQLGARAQAIAAALTQLQPAAVTYSVRQPATLFAAGVRYPLGASDAKLQPYVLGGFGAARVENDVTFELGGVDASATLSQFVTLGSDLSGGTTKPLLTLGGGVIWPAWQQLIIDLQFRYGRIFAEGEGINVGRIGLGAGIRF